jgi:heat shock protein HslJ
MPARSLRWLVVASLVLLGLVGCEAASGPEPADVAGTSWQVASYRDVAGQLADPVAGSRLTLQFAEDGTASGTSGVNQFSGTYETGAGGSLEFGQFSTTLIAGPQDLMDQEQAYLAALGRTTHYREVGEALELLDDGGEVVVRLAPVVAGELEGVEWSCTGYNNGQEAFVSLLADTQITMTLDAGAVSGNATINQYNGSYELDGQGLVFDPALMTTKMAGPPEQMDQESAYLAMLPKVVRYAIEGDVLTLFGESDLRLATYSSAQ